MTGINAKLFRHWSCRSHLLEDPLPNTALRPPVVAIIDRCVRSILRGAIAPAASGLKDVQDATDHPTVIYSRLARFALRKMGLDRCPGVIRQQEQMRHSGLLFSPHPSSREGHHSTARWSSSFLLSH